METLPAPKFEQYDQHEQPATAEHHEQLLLPAEKDATPLQKNEKPAVTFEEAQKAVVETAQSQEQGDPFKRLEQAQDVPQMDTRLQISVDQRVASYTREIKNVRHKLPTLQRGLSKVIHQPAIRVVSEVTSKTISRPSGLFGGGVVALIGTSGYLYTAKHAGFRYNYLVFLMLFVGGYAVGLILELLIWTATMSRRKALD